MTPDAEATTAAYGRPSLTGAGAERLARGPWRVAVIGASGWLGLATLEMLRDLFGARFFERVVCYGSTARTLILRDGLSVEQRPLSDLLALPAAPTLALHLAFLTQEKAKAMPEADYVEANRAISAAVLAALDGIGAEAVFVPSSGAVTLVDDDGAQPSMRLYGRLKLEDEAAFSGWASSRRRRAVIARVFNLSGPYINKQSSYALACFIADALSGGPVSVRATRPVLRSYVAISDLMSVVFALLTDGEKGPVLFDTAGEREYEMTEIAEVVVDTLARGIGIDRPAIDPAAPDRYVGDGRLFARLARRFDVSLTDFPTQIRDTAVFMARPDDGRRETASSR